jgi:hypothetical protein
MRFSGEAGSANILYVVKPGVEPGAATELSLPQRVESYLVQIARDEFILSSDDTVDGRIYFRGMDRGQIGGPSGFIAYTTDPAFSFTGTTSIDPHGNAPSALRYLPLRSTVRFGNDAHTSPVQPFTYRQLTNPNFTMYIVMGNGYTHVIDSTRVPRVEDLIPELESPGDQFRVNHLRHTVSSQRVRIMEGETTAGQLLDGLSAPRDGIFAVFPQGTVIESVEDFMNAERIGYNEVFSLGDLIVVVNAGLSRFVVYVVN